MTFFWPQSKYRNSDGPFKGAAFSKLLRISLCDFVLHNYWKRKLRSTQVASHWRGPHHLKICCTLRAPYRVQELCENRGGRPGLPVLMSLMVSVDVKQHWTMHTHWSQFVPNMSTRHPRTLSSTSSSPVFRYLVTRWRKDDGLMMMKWCLMSSDVRWHIRDKLCPMPKHGSVNLYVHGNQKAR